MLVHAKIDCVKKYLEAKKNWPEEPLQSPSETEKYMCAHCGHSALQSVHLLCGMRVVVAVRLGQSECPKSVECGRVTPTRTLQIDLLNERFQMSNIWLSYDRKRVYRYRAMLGWPNPNQFKSGYILNIRLFT